MVTFNFTYSPGVTIQQALGFEMAGRIWSHFLSDPVTLNFHVGISSSLPTNVIGGALPGMMANTGYETFRGRLQQDATSNRDHAAGLPTGPSFSSSFDLVVEGNWDAATFENRVFSTNTLNVTRAGGKAVGLISGGATALDGAIVMGNLANSGFHWNYNFTRNTTAPTGSLDFLSVAIHEIGHLLGFVSGVDKPGAIINAFWEDGTPSYWASSTTPPPTTSDYWQNVAGRIAYTTPLDLFRVNNSAQKSMTYGGVYFQSGFAPQSGSFAIAPFSKGKDLSLSGDGYQASHWKEQATALGIMDPAIAPRERASISNLDLQAFDAIGWNLRNGLNATAFTTTFLSGLQTQAVSALATRLGQTTTWINSNLTAIPTNLGTDRTADVETMIRNSLIYEWGTTGSGTTSTSGRRWMEIFNQMASAQEVYVNFSTVSTVTPPETIAGNEQSAEGRQSDRQNQKDGSLERVESNWGNSGSGQIGKGPRLWRLLGETSASPEDQLSGMDRGGQLIGRDLVNFPNPGQASPTMTPDFLSTSIVTSVKWNPVATRMSEAAVASEKSLGGGTGSRSQVSLLFSIGLDTLLGTENNPLAQGGLSLGVMGAIA